MLYGLGAASGAPLLAACAVSPPRSGRPVRRRRPRGRAALAGLRALHSGNVADYVAWVVVGVVVMGAFV